MATSISCGIPCFVDYCDEDAQSPYRQYDIGTRVLNVGTASANQVPSGVYPGNGAMAVTAVTGMNVSVSAGYCCVANSTSSLQGGYVFGLMTSGLLTVAAADTTNPRIDLVVAYVSDLGNDSSSSYVAIITGTPASVPSAPSVPANSLILAQIAVAANVTSIVAGNITDERSYVVAPGGILPIQNAASAPAVPPSQFMYNLATGQLVQGTGTAGSVTVVSALKWTPQSSYLTSAVTAAHAGTQTTLATVSVTVDGVTDLEVYTKWPYILGNASEMTLQVQIDSVQADEVTVTTNGTGGGSSRYFTSSAQDDTPAAGTHVITWLFQATGSGTSSSDGVYAAATSPAILRVSPVVV
jgi:hypothetical protein